MQCYYLCGFVLCGVIPAVTAALGKWPTIQAPRGIIFH
jgi:hypothetical protein